MQVYNSLDDIQDKLVDLYIGCSPEFFKQIVPTCSLCNLVAVGTYNCGVCAKELLCNSCVHKGKTLCYLCDSKGEVSPLDELSVNFVADTILQKSNFKCPFPTCNHDSICYGDLEYHITKQCDQRYYYCPNACGFQSQLDKIEDHRLTSCPNLEIKCH